MSGLSYFICIIVLQTNPVHNANSADLDQTQRSVMSDLNLYCFLMSINGTLTFNGLLKAGSCILTFYCNSLRIIYYFISFHVI